jgi:hypothetical protein
MPEGLLKGIRLLDLTNVLAGPYCAYQFALLGADVIKVEAPGGGDLARQLGADDALNRAGMGASFLAQNAGKRSVVLDLKDGADRDRFLALVDSADALVENFRPGVMDRLGLGPAALRARNPWLVHCAISGFGQTGPMRGNPARPVPLNIDGATAVIYGDIGVPPPLARGRFVLGRSVRASGGQKRFRRSGDSCHDGLIAPAGRSEIRGGGSRAGSTSGEDPAPRRDRGWGALRPGHGSAHRRLWCLWPRQKPG